MHTSIAHAPRPIGGKSASQAENGDLRDLLAAIRDALDVPHAPDQAAVLEDRALLVCGTIRDALDGKAPYIPFETQLLREKLAAQDGARHA
jgi:hypothetical protein